MIRLSSLALLTLLPLVHLEAQAASPLTLELVIRVSTCRGKPVRDAAWVKAHVDGANKVFAPHGIHLSYTREIFKPPRCNLITRQHRHELATHVKPGAVTVLIMERIQDLDTPSYNLMGVHWRYRGQVPGLMGRRWVFMTSRARPPVLAHELCHYLGLRHDPAGGNLMTPGPSDPIWKRGPRPKPYKSVLNASQARKIRARIRRIIAARPAATTEKLTNPK